MHNDYPYIPDGLHVVDDGGAPVEESEWHSCDWRGYDGGYRMCAWADDARRRMLRFVEVKRMRSASPGFLAAIWEARYDDCGYPGGGDEPDAEVVERASRIASSGDWERFRQIGTVGVHDSADAAAWCARAELGC